MSRESGVFVLLEKIYLYRMLWIRGKCIKYHQIKLPESGTIGQTLGEGSFQ
jgi:hypothetical protein